jgi:hypothetical protein
LKVENQRLQRFADILDSQPELSFCIDKEGRITLKSAPFDDEDASPLVPIDIGPEKKKAKTSATISSTAFNNAGASSSSNGVSSFKRGKTNADGDVQENKAIVSEEYVCSIRSADASLPHSRGSLLSSSSLSTTSSSSDDLELDI